MLSLFINNFRKSNSEVEYVFPKSVSLADGEELSDIQLVSGRSYLCVSSGADGSFTMWSVYKAYIYNNIVVVSNDEGIPRDKGDANFVLL